MKKNIINSIFGLAVASLMLTACSNAEDAVTQSPAPATDDTAINFGAYMNRNTTRGGYEGELTTEILQGAANGFGVLAYYTDNQPYNPNATPNFMYNQQVKYETDDWTYSPLKYWPNEFGENATSTGIDKLSFFAYAPYVAVDPVTGYASPEEDEDTGEEITKDYGIVGMTRSAENGNPKVRYYVSLDPSTQVDLCWSKPVVNKVKTDYAISGEGSQVTFNFNHALASLNVQIDAMFDELTTGENTVDPNSRIWVRSVTFEGLALKGELNLNNDVMTAPEWNDLYSNGLLIGEPVTIYDGRRDGREGFAAMPNEKPVAINTDLVQSGAYEANETNITAPAQPGVTAQAANLFSTVDENGDLVAPAPTAPIYVIPTGEPLRITIVYDVETVDENLVSSYLSDNQTHGVSVENTITKTILLDPEDLDSGLTLEAGKRYTINLHLGMSSVKTTATVSNWSSGDDADTNLPGNEQEEEEP